MKRCTCQDDTEELCGPCSESEWEWGFSARGEAAKDWAENQAIDTAIEDRYEKG